MKVMDIKSPQDIKNLNLNELQNLNDKIRDFLINSVSKTGGHLGSSLGTVDLISMLHYIFTSPKDKIIFDVGHQAYAHKILTGRAKDFKTLRQYKGLSGFLKSSESEHDVWESGHASNSISAATGFAMQRDIDGDDNHVIAVIGDGSLNGMGIEALNHIIELNMRIIIVINDNNMSISSNIGFISQMFKGLEVSTSYDNTKKAIRKSINKIDSSEKITKKISNLKNKFKNEINSTKGFFNILGFKYYGPVDGHNLKDLQKNLKEAKKFNGPTIVHVKTIKGKGYLPAEKNSWHGVSPFDIETGKIKESNNISNSKVISTELEKIMSKDENVIAITPAMLTGSELEQAQEKFPNRITDVGIAEEHGATLAAGLALAGKKPFLVIYSTFLQRAYDQVFQDIARQNCNVVVGIDRAGIVGGDGETHQGIYDISFLLHMPNVILMHGKDTLEMRCLLNLAFETNGPTFLRYSKSGINTQEQMDCNLQNIKLGKWDILTKGKKLNILSFGEDVCALEEEYKDNENVGVINARFIKPLDEEVLKQISHLPIIVVEESARIGGFGSFVLNYYNINNIDVNLHSIAIDDHFVEHGDIPSLKKQEKIDLDSIKSKVEEILNGKN